MPSASSDDDHKLQTSILHSRDDLDFIDDGADESHTGYGNTYTWVTLESALSPSLLARTTLSSGRITHDREGIGYFGDNAESDVEFTVRDDRSFDFLALKQDWNFDRSDVHYLKWGF